MNEKCRAIRPANSLFLLESRHYLGSFLILNLWEDSCSSVESICDHKLAFQIVSGCLNKPLGNQIEMPKLYAQTDPLACAKFAKLLTFFFYFML